MANCKTQGAASMPIQHPPQSTMTPQGSSAFEHVVRRLGLLPSQYATSAELKEWVRKNKDQKYVPPYLLDLWGFDVDDELFGKTADALKRTA
jgi:hypothetical protein